MTTTSAASARKLRILYGTSIPVVDDQSVRASANRSTTFMQGSGASCPRHITAKLLCSLPQIVPDSLAY